MRRTPYNSSNKQPNRRRGSIAAIGVIILAIVIPGCSAFQGSRKMDLGPFADNTTAMFADAQKVARPLTWIHLKPYQNAPEVQQFREAAGPILKSLRSVVLYSNQLVALSQANFSDKDKNAHLASYLTEATKSAVAAGKLAEIGISNAEIDSIFSNIRRSESFLDGIKAAGPLINAFVATMDDRLSNLQDAMLMVTRSIDQRIESENTEMRQNLGNLTRLQNQFLREATLLYDYKLGNAAALDTILLIDASMKNMIESTRKKSGSETDAIEKVLSGRSAQIQAYREQLLPDIAAYQAKEKELEELRVAIESRIKLARGVMMVWGQSHRNLGDGIPVPPMIDVTGTVTGLIGGAAKTVIP